MDAVDFFETRDRMCSHYDGCEKCPLDTKTCAPPPSYPEKAVAIVERWGKEHPVEEGE